MGVSPFSVNVVHMFHKNQFFRIFTFFCGTNEVFFLYISVSVNTLIGTTLINSHASFKCVWFTKCDLVYLV